MRLGRRLLLSTAAASAVAPSVRSAHAAETDVLVIGAGVAGLAAARTLAAANRSVLVVEARERIGGRAVTDTTFGFPVDLGAQWIEGARSNPAGAILRDLNARPVADRGQQSIYLGGTEAPREEYARYEKIAVDASRKLAEALKKAPDVAVGRVLVAQDPLERLAYAMVGPLESGVELDRLSARDFLRQPEADPQVTVAEGLGALVARWGGRVPVKLGTRVVRIDSTGGLVMVVTTNGQLTARTVIVTVPTGVLESGPFGFAPPLPAAKREAIAQLPMAAYNKIVVSFGRKMIDAPANRSVLGLTRRQQAFDAVVRPQGQDAAIVLVGGAQAQQIEEDGAGAAVSFAVSALAEIYGDTLRGQVVRSHATRWGRDPFARGAWSMALPGHADKRTVLAQPHHDRVFFAGEATDPVWAARVGGAYASGVRAAREALAVLGTRR